ncbi:MAG: hypothetical protein LBS67_04680, partial [Clostridiales Family XIII bacterium]|nr:hypothetical protein [Clostridiales Family XIII bacterium]
NAVSLEKIVDDALGTNEGFAEDSQYVTADTDSDKPGSWTFSYDDLTTDSNFYPATGPVEKSTTGAVHIEPALALTSTLDNITSTASGDLSDWDGSFTSQKDMQFVRGISEADYLNQPSKFGMRFLTGIDSITVIEYADSTLDEVANDLDKKVDDLNKNIDDLNDELSQKDADNAKLAAEKALLEKEKAELAKQAADLQKQLDAANQAVFTATTATISKLKAGKKSAVVTWKKIKDADGYQIVYAASKKFSGKKTATVKGAAAVNKTIKSLKKGKTYYFKVRGYSNRWGKTVYSKYSPVKQIKIKK